MIAAHAHVLAREPARAALAEDYVAGHDELAGCALEAEAFSGPRGGFVGAALGGVGGGAGLLGVVVGEGVGSCLEGVEEGESGAEGLTEGGEEEGVGC